MISDCASFYAETNLDELSDTFRMPNTVLSFDDYFTHKQAERIKRQCQSFQLIPFQMLRQLHPMAAITMTTASILDHKMPGLDHGLWSIAKNEQLNLGGIETVDEQRRYFQEIPESMHWKQLKTLLFNLTGYRKKIEKLRAAYSAQKIHELYRITREDLGTMRHLMINRRNPVMIERIHKILCESKDPTFFCLGAAHLSGIHGIIHGLKLKSIVVKPIKLLV